MNRSMPGLPVHHQLPEFTETHVHRVSDAIQSSHPLSSPSPLCFKFPFTFYTVYITYACILSCFSCVQLFVIPWTLAHQAPLFLRILQARILEWFSMPSSRESSQTRDWTCVSCVYCIAGGFFTTEPLGEAHILYTHTHTYIRKNNIFPIMYILCI